MFTDVLQQYVSSSFTCKYDSFLVLNVVYVVREIDKNPAMYGFEPSINANVSME